MTTVPSPSAPQHAPVPQTPPGPPAGVSGDYGAEQIQVLEGLEAVRKRPGMYIGGTGLNALHHLVYEVVDNSIDEAMAGHAAAVNVTIHPDGSCTVTDDGRGIPIGPMKHDDPALNGKPAVEVVLTKLHAGGKFGQEGSAYKVSGGLHGVGVSCVNALSDRLRCEVYREGRVHAIEFERGRVREPLHEVGRIPAGSSRERGTTVTFHPDATIFPDTTFDFETLASRLRELSFLNPGVTLRLTDERVGPDGRVRSESFRAENGLIEYVGHLMTGKTSVAPPVYIRREDPALGLVCEAAFQYHDGYSESLLSFANNINNVDGGTHAGGFKVALTRTLNGYARKSGIIKDKDPVPSGEDLREGLVCIVSVKLPNPTFNNQPKEKLLNPEIEGFVSGAVSEALEAWLEEHPADARRLCLKGIIAAQAREAARKARELTRRKSGLEGGGMPHKLRDCKTRNVEESEIYIVEGDSAGGTATQGRDVETQAILPLRGKILNVEKARIDRMLAFEEIRTLISALRVGIGQEQDLSKLRYGKVIIMTDADVDGSHIRTLLLTFFYRQMPELIRRGHVYLAQPPLYRVERTGKKGAKTRWYALNQKILDDVLTNNGLANAALIVREVRGEEAREAARLDGDRLRRAIFILRRLVELAGIAERRGVRFTDLLAERRNDPSGAGRLPTHRVSWRGGGLYAWTEEQALDVLRAEGRTLTESGEGNGGSAQLRELHENRELDRLIAELGELGIDARDYDLTRGESVSGARLPTKYAWVVSDAVAEDPAAEAQPASGVDTSADQEAAGPVESNDGVAASGAAGRVVEAENLPGILDALTTIGERGLRVSRFKGLGEMDASELWQTTMDPTSRTLLRVSPDAGSSADRLFSVLMGEEVEPRRRFIEEHALDVKNLDV
ncbi:MAG: DNA gyrase subunit B [Phycisphaeraceae bacterium]|nr:MAG: DNA gyrase subunit B [Phycisphaeraceae bacterium]